MDELPACCEVCGTGSAVGALLHCKNYSKRHQVGCHSFCLPASRHVAGMQHAEFTCLACLDAATQPGSVQAAAGSGLVLPAATAQPAADMPADGFAGPAGTAAINSQGVAPGRAAAAADWSQLPADVLAHILRHVPVQHRLTTCTLVHSNWAAAAKAATCSLSLQKDTEEALLQLWGVCGPKYGQQLTSLRLAGPFITPFLASSSDTPVLKQLSCPGLQDLDLSSIRVQLGPGESTDQGSADTPDRSRPLALGGVFQAVTGLTRLSLSYVWVVGPHDSEVAALAALPRLQHLGLHYVSRVSSDVTPYAAHKDAEPALLFLEGLVQLTCLKLSCWRYSSLVAALQNNSSLTNLKHLELSTGHHRAKSGAGRSWLQQLSQLTQLRLTGVKNLPPRPAFPPSLRALQMASCDVDMALLAAVTQLQHVQFSSCQVVGGPLGVAALLAWLQQQEELVSLCIQGTLVFPGRFSQQFVSPGAYAGLTASSKLQRLVLKCERVSDAAWHYIFLPGQQLLQLTSLDLTITGKHVPGEIQQHQMVQVCPGLRQLRLFWGSETGSYRDRQWRRGSWLQVSVLLPLTGLTSLSFNYALQRDVPELVQLPWLQELHLAAPSLRGPVTAMLPLTSLQQLTLLKVDRQMPTREQPRDRDGDHATNTTLFCKMDDKPVWLQLLECCQGAAEAKRKQKEEAQRSAALEPSPDILPQYRYPKGYPIRSHKPPA